MLTATRVRDGYSATRRALQGLCTRYFGWISLFPPPAEPPILATPHDLAVHGSSPQEVGDESHPCTPPFDRPGQAQTLMKRSSVRRTRMCK